MAKRIPTDARGAVKSAARASRGTPDPTAQAIGAGLDVVVDAGDTFGIWKDVGEILNASLFWIVFTTLLGLNLVSPAHVAERLQNFLIQVMKEVITPGFLKGDEQHRVTGEASNLSEEQNEVIRTIIETGKELGASDIDIEIAIATCLVESQCRQIDYGDRDSIGAFQQRPSQGWPNTNDTKTQAVAFFRGSGTNPGLFDIDGRESTPGAAAQRVQRSAFPLRYSQRMDEARAIYASFRVRSSSGTYAFPTLGGMIPTGKGFVYGMRTHPVTGDYSMHNGIDIQGPLGTPLVAYCDGTITHYVGTDGKGDGFGEYALLITCSDGDEAWYGHNDSMRVTDGQKVNTGDVIGTLGTRGLSSGPHLHFEIRRNGMPIDPAPVLKERLGL